MSAHNQRQVDIIVAGGNMHWMAYLLISGPPFLIAALFLAGWLYRRNPPPGA